ncbi:MAG: hypothetical protein PHI97_14740, partial [Desulfobulbus sp.]|nr:hypothetical protein [Desulfobulbus sp.]
APASHRICLTLPNNGRRSRARPASGHTAGREFHPALRIAGTILQSAVGAKSFADQAGCRAPDFVASLQGTKSPQRQHCFGPLSRHGRAKVGICRPCCCSSFLSNQSVAIPYAAAALRRLIDQELRTMKRITLCMLAVLLLSPFAWAARTPL